MSTGTGRGGDPSVGATVRGVVLILICGVTLAIAHNMFGRASHPPRGLAWVASADSLPSLESLQADAAARARAVGAVGSAAPVVSSGDRAPASRPTDASSPASSAAAPEQAPVKPPAMPVVPDVGGPLKIEIAALKKLYDAGAVLIMDARETDAYVAGHLAGAISLPYNDALDDPNRAKRLDSGGRAIVVYCDGGACTLSMDLASLLVSSGKRRVLVYEGGYPEWREAGYPVASGGAGTARP